MALKVTIPILSIKFERVGSFLLLFLFFSTLVLDPIGTQIVVD